MMGSPPEQERKWKCMIEKTSLFNCEVSNRIGNEERHQTVWCFHKHCSCEIIKMCRFNNNSSSLFDWRDRWITIRGNGREVRNASYLILQLN